MTTKALVPQNHHLETTRTVGFAMLNKGQDTMHRVEETVGEVELIEC